jgi:hypothetical protein
VVAAGGRDSHTTDHAAHRTSNCIRILNAACIHRITDTFTSHICCKLLLCNVLHSVIAVTASRAEALYECDVGDVRMQRDVRDVIVCTDKWRVTPHYTAGQPLYVDRYLTNLTLLLNISTLYMYEDLLRLRMMYTIYDQQACALQLLTNAEGTSTMGCASAQKC